LFIFAVNSRFDYRGSNALHQLVWRAIPMRKLARGKQMRDRERVGFGETAAEKAQQELATIR